jgi:uncharacterized protein
MDLLKRLFNHGVVLWLLLFAVLPASLWGAWNAWKSTANDVVEWMPANLAAADDLRHFIEWFGSDELLMISWAGCRPDDPRISAYREILLQPVNIADAPVPLYRQVIAAPDLIEFYESAPLDFSRDQSIERMRGWLCSDDGELTGLIALVSQAGADNRHAAIEHAAAAADRTPGLSRHDLHMAGPTIESVAIDQASQEHLLELNLISYALCFCLMLACLRHPRAVLVLFFLALFNEQLCLAIIWYSSGRMDSVLLLAANLTFVLSISIGLHLFNYYQDRSDVLTDDEAPLASIRAAFRPTFLSVLTTSLGLGSLAVSTMRPISRFGSYAAISLFVSMVVMLVYLPLHLKMWPIRAKSAGHKPGDSGRKPRFARLQASVQAFRNPILAGTITLILLGGYHLRDLRTSVGLHDLLTPAHRTIGDYAWIEERIGPLIPLEVVLTMPSGDPKRVVDQYHSVANIHNRLQQSLSDVTVISSVNFTGELPPRQGGIRQRIQATLFRKILVENQERLRELGFVQLDPSQHRWRLSVRTSSSRSGEYGHLISQLRQTVHQVLQQDQLEAETEVLVCGGVPLVFQAQQQVLDDLIASFSLAFFLVGGMLMLIFRSAVCGAICMIPNVMPAALVFGWMGWQGRPVEVGTVLTASAALGISVDDSLHFITWFQRSMAAGETVLESVRAAYRHCAIAMIQTTLVISCGLMVFFWSGFQPIARFGMFMGILLSLALIADLVVLPAILMSPLGRFFTPKERARQAAEATCPITTIHGPGTATNDA